MKKISIILIILLFPIFVHSETISVCKSGCDYDNLDSALEYSLTNEDSTKYLSIIDDAVYSINKDYDFTSNRSLIFTSCISSTGESNIQCNNNININGNNHTIKAHNIYFRGIGEQNLDFDTTTTETIINLSKRSKFNIEDISLSFQEMFITGGIYNINNCSIESNKGYDIEAIGSSMAYVYIKNSSIRTVIMPGAQIGGPGFNSKFYLDDTNTYKKPIKREKLDFLDSNAFNIMENLSNDKTHFTELLIIPTLKSMGENFTWATDELENELYYTQTKDKTIKNDTSITEFEKEFTNTYIDSYGFTEEEINAPVVWTSEDESIAKISNGVVTPIRPGTVVLTGTRNHDIYKINLTVEKETIAEKIDEMTVNIPITGTKIKVWVLVSIIMLFGVIGVIIYLLIKNKKSK